MCPSSRDPQRLFNGRVSLTPLLFLAEKLVGDEQVAMPLECQECFPESFQMGATKFLYKATDI
jgi:hypothetical protein